MIPTSTCGCTDPTLLHSFLDHCESWELDPATGLVEKDGARLSFVKAEKMKLKPFFPYERASAWTYEEDVQMEAVEVMQACSSLKSSGECV